MITKNIFRQSQPLKGIHFHIRSVDQLLMIKQKSSDKFSTNLLIHRLLYGYSESWGAMIKRLLVTDAPVDGNGGVTSVGGSGGSEGNANTGTRISN
jgi:hypothetical protein